MTTFDKREQAFEAEFVHDEEVRFKAIARSNKLLGNWAAAKLGLVGEGATAYANALVVAELEHSSAEETLRKVSRDLAATGVSEFEVASKMREFLNTALQQIKAGV
jgi:hypothetical protein